MNTQTNTIGQVDLFKFNKEISVTVPVDSIAKKLYETMDKTNPHAALITNVIIGTSLSENTINQIYNALNGWKDEVNITVGKNYMINGNNLNNIYSADKEWRKGIVPVMVTGVNEYTSNTDNIEIKFEYKHENGEMKSSNCSVRHTELMEFIEP